MLERQRSRLLREDPWPDATALSQELYAMFTDDQPLQVPGVEANPAPGVIPYTVNYPPGEDNVPMMSINRGSDSFDLSIGPSGLTFIVNGAPTPVVAGSAPKKTTGGGGFTAEITENISGNIYGATISDGSETLDVAVMNLGGDSDNPLDTPFGAVVTKVGNSYYMQVATPDLPGIVSGGGSGSYGVSLLNGNNITALQVVIDDGDTPIPPGTGVIVSRVGSVYYMQVPCWL